MFDEDFENLDEGEQERLRERFSDLEERLDRLEVNAGQGDRALTHQRRLMFYLDELRRILESELDVDLPAPPAPEE